MRVDVVSRCDHLLDVLKGRVLASSALTSQGITIATVSVARFAVIFTVVVLSETTILERYALIRFLVNFVIVAWAKTFAVLNSVGGIDTGQTVATWRCTCCTVLFALCAQIVVGDINEFIFVTNDTQCAT